MDSAKIVASVLLLSSVLVYAEPSKDTAEQSLYERRHSFNGSVFKKDNNVWLVSPAFAKRMYMPVKFVSQTLPVGIEALAIRYQRYFTQICSSDDPSSCYTPANCYLDIYAAPAAKLPWLDDGHAHVDMDSPDSSWFYLRFKQGDFQRVFAPRSLKLSWQTPQQRYPGRVVEYEKEFFPQLDFISTVFDCSLLQQTSAQLTISGVGQALHIKLDPLYQQQAVQHIQQSQQQFALPGTAAGTTPLVFKEALFRLIPEREALNALKAYARSPYAWVYSRAFATRFLLPKEWISDELGEGLEAMVYRKQYYDNKKCGYFGSADKCSLITFEFLDVFTKPNLNKLWRGGTNSIISKGQFSASHYQLDRSLTDRRHWERPSGIMANISVYYKKGILFKREVNDVAVVGSKYFQRDVLGYDFIALTGLGVYEQFDFYDVTIRTYLNDNDLKLRRNVDAAISVPDDFFRRAKEAEKTIIQNDFSKDVMKLFKSGG